MLKYILIGLSAVVLQWIFIAFIDGFFDGDRTANAVVAVGVFIVFEIIICTGAVIECIKKNM